jgi:large subunit ribosomal protein L10
MRAEKNYLIAEVEAHLKKSDYVILANYTKVTVADVAELRAQLAKENAEFHVVKNSSLRVAAKALGLPDIESALVGPTAVIVGGENSAGVAKILKKFFESKQKLEIKVGVMEQKILTAEYLSQIADLPSFEALRRPNNPRPRLPNPHLRTLIHPFFGSPVIFAVSLGSPTSTEQARGFVP